MLRYADAPGKGRAVFAACDVSRGSTMLTEAPLLSMALPESRGALLACERCCRAVGTVTAQLRHLTGMQRIPELPIDTEDDHLADSVPCRHGCGVWYCSATCEALHAPAHRYLCRGCSPAAAMALDKFEEHALATYECFLFGARLVADLLARGAEQGQQDQYADLCRESVLPWVDHGELWMLRAPRLANVRCCFDSRCATSMVADQRRGTRQVAACAKGGTQRSGRLAWPAHEPPWCHM